jgi:AI-2 transport protein TqsA
MDPPPIRAELRLQTICMAILTTMAVASALYWLRPVMIPFVVAAFLAFALRPIVDRLEVYVHLPRTLAVCAALLLALLALLSIGWLVKVSVSQVTSNLTQYEKQVQKLIDDAEELISVQKYWSHPKSQPNSEPPASDKPAPQENRDGEKDKKTGVQYPDQLQPPGQPKDDAAANIAQHQRSLNPFEILPDGLLQSWFWNITGTVADVVKQSGVVLIFLFFLLLSSVKRDQPIGGAWGEVESQIRAYLFTMTALSAACGIAVWLVLAMFGVQAAVLFGLLTFLLNFIPNIGSAIATVLPLPFIWMSPTLGTPGMILASVIPAVIQFVIGNFLQPNLMGNSMKLHPVVILMALIFWGMIWGIVGMFLAVPITSIIRIACDRHELTKPVADLMAGNLDALRNDATAPTVARDSASR